jgi:hypothetical protein
MHERFNVNIMFYISVYASARIFSIFLRRLFMLVSCGKQNKYMAEWVELMLS